MSSLAVKTKLNRENLYRVLSKRGNPKLTTIRSLLDEMGLQLTVQSYKRD